MVLNKGGFIGIGIGPGDPELITIKAVKEIEAADYICLPRSGNKTRSIAYEIIKNYIKRAELLDMPYSMSEDIGKRYQYWRRHTEKVIELCRQGKRVTFVTLGDPCIYSTFDYILDLIKKIASEIEIRIIPGINSVSASSAQIKETLIRLEESLTIQPCRRVLEKDRNWWIQFDCVAVMKIGKKLSDLVEGLDRNGLMESSTLLTNIGFNHQNVIKGEQIKTCGSDKGYLSIMLVRPHKRDESYIYAFEGSNNNKNIGKEG